VSHVVPKRPKPKPARPESASAVDVALQEATAWMNKMPLEELQRKAVRDPNSVRGLWANYSRPRVKVIEEDIDGKTRITGGICDGRVVLPTWQPGRRRKKTQEVARTIRWYYLHAAGQSYQQIGAKFSASPRTVESNVRWFRRQLDQFPVIGLPDNSEPDKPLR
jgi:hypothetical protein